MIVIIDYGVGNLGSFRNIFRRIGIRAKVSSLAEDIILADKLILPGVGAFDNGMENLKKAGLIGLLSDEVLGKNKPILGVCLGMQMLMDGSEEGLAQGLGWIKGYVKKFDFSTENQELKIPHMGWNKVQFKEGSLFHQIEKPRFYFVHSYYASCQSEENVVGTTQYGLKFASAIQQENILGVQFHPEKSHQFGMSLLKKYAEL